MSEPELLGDILKRVFADIESRMTLSTRPQNNRESQSRAIIDRMRNYKPAPAASPKDNSDLWASKAGDDLLVASPGRPLEAPGTDDLPFMRPTAGGRACEPPKAAREPGQDG